MIIKISEETINAILRKTAYRLPDNPSEQGMKAADIKKAFYQFIDDATASLTSEINRIVEEANNDIASREGSVDEHINNKNNPHEVTKTQVGLGNVDNTSDIDKPISTLQQEAITAVQGNLTEHEEDTNNPHGVTKAQIGLENVDNTSDTNKPISTATQAALDLKFDKEDVADNLTTESASKALSAKQGKILKDSIPSGYGKTIDLSYVSATGVLTIILKDENSNVLSTKSVDLPLELLLASSGSYYENGVIYLKLANGSFINIDVSGLVSAYTADGQTISLSNGGVFSLSSTYKTMVDEANTLKHSHTNKDLLDTYTQTNANIEDAVSKKHNHSNESVLNSTTASFTIAKDTALSNVTKQTSQITIAAGDWAGGTSCTKSVSIVSSSNDVFYSPNESSYAAFTQAEIRVSAQANGTLTFVCNTIPTVDITINITVFGG